MKQAKSEFIFNPIPALSDEQLYLMESLRKKTIGLMKRAYPSAYIEDKYIAKTRPRTVIPPQELLNELVKIYTSDVIARLAEFERSLRPQLENRGFERILNGIFPSVMGLGHRSDYLKVSVHGHARCMDCFESYAKDGRSSYGKDFYKIHKPEEIELVTAPLEEIVDNWSDILPTDVRLASNQELRQMLTPYRQLDNPYHNPSHDEIITLSAVIVFRYVDGIRGREKFIEGSHRLDMRDKAGFEMLRKIVNYLIGHTDFITDGIGSRSIVPEEAFTEVFVRTIRDYPVKTALYNSIVASNYTERDVKALLEDGENRLSQGDFTLLKYYLSLMQFDKKNARVKHKGKERLVKDIEWMAPFGDNDGNPVMGRNVIKHMEYTSEEFTAFNGTKGYDYFDYMLRREEHAKEHYTLGQWFILNLLSPTIYDDVYKKYAKRVSDVRLEQALSNEIEQHFKRSR